MGSNPITSTLVTHYGAIAQLAERNIRNVEVLESCSGSSTQKHFFMEKEQALEEFVEQFLDDYYSSATAATRLHDIFPHNLEGIWNYVKVGRQFWKYNDKKNVFELITITYVRSDVAFYTTEGYEEEQFLPKGCIALDLLYPRVLYLKDIYENSRLSESDKPPYEHLVAMYTKMRLGIPADYVKIDIEQ